jgi:peptidoglycan-associated lipoprotein
MIMSLAVLVSFAACAKKPKPDESATPNAPAADENVMGDSDSGKAMGLQTVHFPYDSFTLDSEAKSVLKSNAEILKEKTGLKIQIEGHCDQRGGIQYNIALGEKRANATKNYIVDMGVSADRITTISYGKERLVDSATTEAAMAQNRRANFVITAK